MLESIVAEIDAEIARLQAVKALLSPGEVVGARGRPGRPAGPAKRRTLSAEARERIRQAQIKRWAATKKAAKSPNVNAAVAPLSTGKKKAVKGWARQ